MKPGAQGDPELGDGDEPSPHTEPWAWSLAEAEGPSSLCGTVLVAQQEHQSDDVSGILNQQVHRSMPRRDGVLGLCGQRGVVDRRDECRLGPVQLAGDEIERGDAQPKAKDQREDQEWESDAHEAVACLRLSCDQVGKRGVCRAKGLQLSGPSLPIPPSPRW